MIKSNLTSPFYQTPRKQMPPYSISLNSGFISTALNAEEKEVHSEWALWRQIHSRASFEVNTICLFSTPRARSLRTNANLNPKCTLKGILYLLLKKLNIKNKHIRWNIMWQSTYKWAFDTSKNKSAVAFPDGFVNKWNGIKTSHFM